LNRLQTVFKPFAPTHKPNGNKNGLNRLKKFSNGNGWSLDSNHLDSSVLSEFLFLQAANCSMVSEIDKSQSNQGQQTQAMEPFRRYSSEKSTREYHVQSATDFLAHLGRDCTQSQSNCSSAGGKEIKIT
jgi:hypothetical protein